MKNAYVTVLAGGDAYVPGAEVLAHSLRASGTRIPLVALATPDVSTSARAILRAAGWEVREVDPIANPAPPSEVLYPRFANVFTKLRAWELCDIERLVLLDADTLVLKNVDELFARSNFAAAPDFLLPDHFNSGVMVLEPSSITFRAMTHSLASYGTYDGGDQGFLNTFFSEWYAMPVEHRLPIAYNTAHFIFAFLRSHAGLRGTLVADTKIVHYMVQKPWLSTATLTGGSAMWWDVYFDVHPDRAGEWKQKLHNLEDWSFDKAVSLI